jgi:hypothetical protein
MEPFSTQKCELCEKVSSIFTSVYEDKENKYRGEGRYLFGGRMRQMPDRLNVVNPVGTQVHTRIVRL